MLFGKKDHLVGLDIGSRSIKASEIIDSKKGRSLKNFGYLELSSGSIEDGVIKDPNAVADSIRQLFKEHHFKEQNVAVSIGGYSVIVKNIVVENQPEAQLQETIPFEAEQYIPFDISDVNIDFLILGESENNPNQLNVLLIAAKKEIINEYFNLIKLAGLNPCIIDVDAFALQNIYEANYGTADQNIALIDIGASKTALNILKEGTSVFIRDVSMGCSQINQKISSLLNCSFEEAEKFKLGEQTEMLSPGDLEEIESSVVSGWCTEIRRALDFFYSTYPDDQIKRILLSGGGANINEFHDLLASETSIEVETINPLQNIQYDEAHFESTFLKKIAPQAALCMGLALRRIDDK
jgi:type IV pilus assembly protein PilM